jgi:hypothetical protein
LPFLLGDVSARAYAEKYLSGRPHIDRQGYRELFTKWTKLYPAEKRKSIKSGEVLILGNGISRLAYDSLIRTWPGEVWACNKAYLDYPEKITRLTGHKEVMLEAVEFRKEHGLLYEIWANNLGNFEFADRDFDCPADMKRDSGTTLAAQALYEGRNIALCGIDLGGPDIHSPDNEKKAKHNWITRWRKIIEVYGKDRIRFIGHNHMPFLLSGKAPSEYSRRYMQEKPHIPNEEYFDVWEKWAGRPAIPFKESQMVRVRYKDGREIEMNDFIAAKMERKGKIMIIKEGQTVHAGREKFTGEISEEKAAELGIKAAPVAAAVAVAEPPEPIPEKKKPAFSPRGGRGRAKK